MPAGFRFAFDISKSRGSNSFHEKNPRAFIASTLILAGCSAPPPAKPLKRTFSSFDLPTEHAQSDLSPTPHIHFQNVELEQALNIYGAYSGRTVIHGSLPDAKITFQTDAPVNRIQLLQMFDTVLAQNNIAMVYSGADVVKAVMGDQMNAESPPEINLPWQSLPESSSVMMRKVRLKNLKPSEVLPALQPFAKLPNSILAIDKQQLLILRDYSANIRQELRMIEELEQKH